MESRETLETYHSSIFFIKDRIDNNELKVTWCPTEDMVADYFMKTLQGIKFKQFRNIILNLK